MPEQLNLTNPVVKTINYYTLQEIRLARDGAVPSFYIRLSAPNGEMFIHQYLGETALQMIVSLNKANLITKSLERRIMEKLIADNILSGSISGTPD